jgi:hypothetical protein
MYGQSYRVKEEITSDPPPTQHVVGRHRAHSQPGTGLHPQRHGALVDPHVEVDAAGGSGPAPRRS